MAEPYERGPTSLIREGHRCVEVAGQTVSMFDWFPLGTGEFPPVPID
jgi:hypothetical protein